MSLIVLRHTRPDCADGLCYGRTDVALAQSFEAEAAAIVAALPPASRVVASPSPRCARLAVRLAAARGLALAEDARLLEIDFGAWEGRPWAAIPRAELDAWAADFQGARPHGGESVAMLAARVGAALAEAGRSDPPELWVTHAGVARAACALTGSGQGWATRLGFGRWLRIAELPPTRDD